MEMSVSIISLRVIYRTALFQLMSPCARGDSGEKFGFALTQCFSFFMITTVHRPVQLRESLRNQWEKRFLRPTKRLPTLLPISSPYGPSSVPALLSRAPSPLPGSPPSTLPLDSRLSCFPWESRLLPMTLRKLLLAPMLLSCSLLSATA